MSQLKDSIMRLSGHKAGISQSFLQLFSDEEAMDFAPCLSIRNACDLGLRDGSWPDLDLLICFADRYDGDWAVQQADPLLGVARVQDCLQEVSHAPEAICVPVVSLLKHSLPAIVNSNQISFAQRLTRKLRFFVGTHPSTLWPALRKRTTS